MTENTELTQCPECGCDCQEGELVETLHGFACQACIDENYVMCTNCEGYERSTQVYERADGSYICLTCRFDEFSSCSCCADLFHNEDLIAIANDNFVCGECFEQETSSCPRCGTRFLDTEGFVSDVTENTYCSPSCQNEAEDEYEENHCSHVSYWHKEDVEWHLHSEWFDESDMFLGVELEVDDGNNPDDCWEEVDNSTSLFLCKTDGSLSSAGLEFVSHPATLAYHVNHRADWETVTSIAKGYGYTSHDNGKCGLHVHVSREAFGSGRIVQMNTALNIIRLFERFDYQFSRFARRQPNGYCQKQFVPGSDSLIERIRIKTEDYDRYKTLNLTCNETIEFRLYRGTLNVETIMATLQMTAGLVRFARKATPSMVESIDWYTLCDTVAEHAQAMMRRPSDELSNYLCRRGLSNYEFEDEQGEREVA